MKLEEIIIERETDDLQQQRDMRAAMSDVGMQELQKIEDNPVEYFSQRDKDVDPREAQSIAAELAATDSRTFELIASARPIMASLEQNYNPETNTSFIDFPALQEIMVKVRERQR